MDFEFILMLLHAVMKIKDAELIDCIYAHKFGEEKEEFIACLANNAKLILLLHVYYQVHNCKQFINTGRTSSAPSNYGTKTTEQTISLNHGWAFWAFFSSLF